MSEKMSASTAINGDAKQSSENSEVQGHSRDQEIGQLALGAVFEKSEIVNNPNLGVLTASIYTSDMNFEPKTSRRGAKIPYVRPEHAYDEIRLKNTPALRYSADPNNFPLFSLQTEHTRYGGEETKVQRPLDATLSDYVTRTAAIVKKLSGDAYTPSNAEKLPRADHVIYLDKSARPVSWLVDEFWDEFSPDAPRVEKSFLAIDRSPWLNRAGQKVDIDGRFVEGTEKAGELANFSDFLRGAEQNITAEDLAKVRALYIEGGIDTEDPTEIMKLPTILDGKNVTIVDEVQRTGTTSNIAKWLIEHAIPEVKSVNFIGFWQPATLKNMDGSDTMISSVPVWYDAKRISGRGVGEIRPEYYKEQFANDPTPVNRAHKFGAELIGTPFNPSHEQAMDARFGSPSLELHNEIKELHEEFKAGHVFLAPTIELGMKYRDYMVKEGLTAQVDERFSNYVPSTSVTSVLKSLKSRPAVKY